MMVRCCHSSRMNQHPIQTGDGVIERWLPVGRTATTYPALPWSIDRNSLRLHFLLNNLQKIRPVRGHRLWIVKRHDPRSQPIPALIFVGLPPSFPQILSGTTDSLKS